MNTNIKKQNTKTDETSDAFALYLKYAASFDLLTEKQEKDLAKRVEKGDKEAEDLLFKSNLRLVVSIAKKFVQEGNINLDIMDLVQEGNLGLMTAVKRFDWRNGARFSTYATWWIKQAVQRYVTNNALTIRVPVHQHEKYYRLKPIIDELQAELGRAPSYKEIADKTESLDEYDVQLMVEAFSKTRSLDEPIRSGREESDGDVALGDYVASKDPNLDPESMAEKQALNETIMGLFDKKLSEREKDVLIKRLGFNDQTPMTLAEIGNEYGVSRERIRQIERNAMLKLKTQSSMKKLADWADNPDRAREQAKLAPKTARRRGQYIK